MKTQEDTLLQKNCYKERLGDYSTSQALDVLIILRSQVLQQSSLVCDEIGKAMHRILFHVNIHTQTLYTNTLRPSL